MKTKLLSLFVIVLGTLVFFHPFFLSGKLPIPADTIIGLYHPYRDLYAKDYPNGIPYKNSIATDPVRQQYPWRYLSISEIKKGNLPLWNPYSFAGTPLLANFQSAVFYPLNILFFFLPFMYAWSLLIIAQSLLAVLFLYLYLRKIRLGRYASMFGAFVFAFSGFMTSWMEWNTIGHVALWLPFILYLKEKLLAKFSIKWGILLLFAECSQVFAGHLQTWFYALLLTNTYLFVRIAQITFKKNQTGRQWLQNALIKYLPFFLLGGIVLTITAIQWIPSLQFIFQSARDIDQANWGKVGWFIPWQHLIQFVIPDFFGNPTTLNYWGVWNYGEFIGYIGIIPLIFALYASFFRRDKKTYFFTGFVILSIVFALPTLLAKIPYQLSIPFLSTAQPTRLLFLTDFCLAVLAGLGIDFYLAKKSKKILIPVLTVGIILSIGWILLFIPPEFFHNVKTEDLAATRRNITYSSALFMISAVGLILLLFTKKKQIIFILLIGIFGITYFDLFRFFGKYTSFSSSAYLFPTSATIDFLTNHIGQNRFMIADDGIMPPNFSVMYGLQTIDGYDPLYLSSFAKLIIASERNNGDTSTPFGFNRIVTPKKIDTSIINLLGVKYVLSFSAIHISHFTEVFQEGRTHIYENENVIPRAFLVSETKQVANQEEALSLLFSKGITLTRTAIVEDVSTETNIKSTIAGKAEILSYTPNKVRIAVEAPTKSFLVLTDPYYANWKARLLSLNEENAITIPIYKTDFALRGVVVPQGKHVVEFYITM